MNHVTRQPHRHGSRELYLGRAAVAVIDTISVSVSYVFFSVTSHTHNHQRSHRPHHILPIKLYHLEHIYYYLVLYLLFVILITELIGVFF